MHWLCSWSLFLLISRLSLREIFSSVKVKQPFSNVHICSNLKSATSTELSLKMQSVSHVQYTTWKSCSLQCCFTSTETIRTIRDGEPRTDTSTFTQLYVSCTMCLNMISFASFTYEWNNFGWGVIKTDATGRQSLGLVPWTYIYFRSMPLSSTRNRPLSFISLSHSDNQSESAAKFYSSFEADVGGNVMTLT